MRLTSVSVASAAIATLAGAGFTSAMPGPWSVPQGMIFIYDWLRTHFSCFVHDSIRQRVLISTKTEHFEVLSMRQSIPLNPDAVSDVQCLDPEA